MFLSKLILLFFIFVIDRLEVINTSSLIIGNNTELKMENMLIEFMTDLKKFDLDNMDHLRLMIFGKNKNFLQIAKVLVQESNAQYFISNESEAIVLPQHFSADSVVLFFIDGFSDSEINSVFSKLPSDYRCKVLIISVKDMPVDMLTTTPIASVFEMNARNVLLVHFDRQIIKFYKKGLTQNCVNDIKLINTWVPKKGFEDNKSVLDPTLIQNKRKCSENVSTFTLLPMMKLKEDENKSLQITGGLEGYLVKTIAKYLNIIPVVKVPSVREKLWFMPDGRVSGIVGDVARGVAIFGIGQIRPTLDRANLVDMTTPYSHECIVWTVPLITKYNYSVVVSEFSSVTWATLIISISLCCVLVYTIPKLKIGYRSFLTIFDVITMTLNYPIPRHPSSILSKLFILLYLNYSRIISTAYSTSLSSILTATNPTPAIVDDFGIITAGLRTAGTQTCRDLLVDLIPENSSRFELINRYEVTTSDQAVLERMSNHQDIAYLRHRSTIDYIANEISLAGRPVKFYSLSRCMISFNAVMVTPKGSRLTGKINQIILRLREAGIYNYWIRLDRATEVHFTTLDFNDETYSRLESVFLLYLCCLIPAFLTFVTELITFKLKFDWFTR